MMSADIKTDVKQEIKKLVAVSYNFSSPKHLLKTCGWHSMHSLTLPISIGRMGDVKGFLLKYQNLLSMMKLFAEEPLVAGCFHFNSKFISKSSPPVWRCKDFM